MCSGLPPQRRRHNIEPSKARPDYNSGPSFLLRDISTIDFVLAITMLVLLYGIIHLGRGATMPINPTAAAAIDTSSVHLPYYAARSLLRMFVVLTASYGFTLVYGYAAARSRRV